MTADPPPRRGPTRAGQLRRSAGLRPPPPEPDPDAVAICAEKVRFALQRQCAAEARAAVEAAIRELGLDGLEPLLERLCQALRTGRPREARAAVEAALACAGLDPASLARRLRSLEELGLPQRLIGVLNRQEIAWAHDLAGRSAADLLAIPDVGAAGLADVRRALAASGLALRGEQPPSGGLLRPEEMNRVRGIDSAER